MASLFQKATDGVGRYFQKGQGNAFLRKGSKTLTDFAPIISLVNPAYGATAATIGKAGVSLAERIKL